MKHDPNLHDASTQESSVFYDDVILERGNYRIIRGRETRCYAGQYIVQRLEGENWRNLSYHLSWDSIEVRHGAWLG